MARSVLIIGASRGIGLGLAGHMVRQGWQVAAKRRGPAPALEASGAEVLTADIDRHDDIGALAAGLAGRRFEVVLINAGIPGPMHGAADTTPAEVAALFWTNAIAPARAARTLLPLLAEGGRFAFMSSILGSVGGRMTGFAELYSASKAALNSLARSFALTDAAGRPVLCLHPGWVRTDMGGPGADLDVAESAAGIAQVLAAAHPPGCHYLDWRGQPVTW